jgi:adenylate cyclase
VTRSALWGLTLIVGAGVALVSLNLGAPLARLSYDFPFFFQPTISPSEVVVVYINNGTRTALGLESEQPVPRERHAELLERLTRDGARIVYYDVLFHDVGSDPGANERFAAAMRAHGNVVLGAEYHKTLQDRVVLEQTVEPAPIFLDAAKAWGLAAFTPLDPDFVVRQIPPPSPESREAGRIVASLAGSQAHLAQGSETRWLRYYGPSGTLRSYSFHQALFEDGVPPGAFKDRIVCIGGQDEKARSTVFGVDEFANPWSRWGDAFSPGLDVHATLLLNLVRGDWLTRLALPAEAALSALLGVIAWWIFYSSTPLRGVLVVLLAALAIGVGSVFAQNHWGVWWNWLVPALVQFPAALTWSVTTRYATEVRKRARLRDAFSLYLSPEMADHVSRTDFSLKPGGRKTEASVVFTDIKAFTTLCEELRDPQRISDILTDYFTETSRHVLEQDGTIIKYIGDAVFACWNAPLADPDHAVKAVRAAWGISQASQTPIRDRLIVTRVGVCTGEVLAGNLGSPYRFDYTCIGDAVNAAARLESLNKWLGTGVLLAESTRRLVGDQFLTRPLGSFVLAGRSTPMAVHELLGPAAAAGDLAWLQTWEAAMQAVREGAFREVPRLLREVIWRRNGADGPSEFYLHHMATLEAEGCLAGWSGVVRMTEK